METKMIIFDQDGTLYSRDNALMKYTRNKTKKWISEKLNISIIETDKIYEHLQIKYPNPYIGFMSLGCEVQEYMSEVFDKIDPRNFLSFNRKLYDFFKNSQAKKALVTMSSKIYTDKLQTCLKLTDFYDSILYVKDYHTYNKKECYQELAQRNEFDYSEICVVGDSVNNDLLPAKELGCKTVLISKTANNEYKTVKSINEFIDLKAFE